MIDVEQIIVNVHIPSNEVRIVAMQPFIRFPSKQREPFQWSGDSVCGQLTAINRTLDIAQGALGASFANFTLFPEYAIPGVVGASAIHSKISSATWPNESIIIAGIHGLSKDEYRQLHDTLSAHISPSNSPDSVLDHQWVNCCVIWVKDCEGTVQTWIQPKVRPAWDEVNVTCNDMFCGTKVYVFECRYKPYDVPCKFVTMICFDWVASSSGATVCHEFLTKLTALVAPNLTPLDLVFVIQHNPGPNHPSFLNSTYQFLTDVTTHPFIERDKTIVVHANTAVSPRPIRSGLGGYSACVFSPSAHIDCSGCSPTVCMQPSSLRTSHILERCKDIVFREMGECIHAFTVRVPRFINPGVTDRTRPLSLAYVYATGDSMDPRLYGGPVPASVKWICDTLDSVEPLSTSSLQSCPLRDKAAAIEPDIINAIRSADGHKADHTVNLATCAFTRGEDSRDEERRHNADLWGRDEDDSLKHVLHALTSLGLAYSLEFEGTILHATMQGNEGYIQVVAIRGEKHEDCCHHYNRYILPLRRTDPVLVVSHDHYNLSPTPEEYSKIYDTGDQGLVFLDFQSLIRKCRISPDGQTLKEYLDALLPRQNRII